MAIVEFEGQKYEFPDDAQESEIASTLATLPKAPSMLDNVVETLKTRTHPKPTVNTQYREEVVDGVQRTVDTTVDPSKPKADWWDAISAVPEVTLGQTQKAVGGNIRALGDLVRSKTLSDVGEGIGESGDITASEATPKNLSFWKKAALSGGSSVLAQVPTLAASVATGSVVPALAAAGATSFGSSYQENREAGLGGARSAAHSAFDATAEVLMEKIPLKFMLNAGSKPVAQLITGTLAREVPTEVLTTAVQSANAKFSHRPDMTWEEYGQDLLDTVGATMISAPLLGGAAGAMHRAGIGPKEKFVPPPLPELGDNNPPLSAPIKPPFDLPTADVPADTNPEVQALIDSIDADLIDDKQLTAAQETVTKFREAQKAPPLPNAEQTWAALGKTPEIDSGELGASARQAGNASNYTNPNVGPRLERTFLFGPDGVEGLTPAQITPQASTYVLGVETPDRSRDYLKALRDTYEQWRQTYAPNATIILSNEELPFANALGWHYSEKGQHIIVPAPLRSPTKGLGSFNMNTQASAFYNATHEFGHTLVEERFYEGVNPVAADVIRQEASKGLISEQAMAVVPEMQQAVLREFNTLKSQVMDGTMSAGDFVKLWMSPGKAGRKNILEGVDPLGPATALVDKIARQALKSAGIVNPVAGEKAKARWRNY